VVRLRTQERIGVNGPRSIGKGLAAATLVAVWLWAACGGDGGDGEERPTATPTAQESTPAESASPTGSPSGEKPSEPLEFTTGQAHIEVTGDVDQTFDILLDAQFKNRYVPSSDTLDIAYDNQEGAKVTAETLGLTLAEEPPVLLIVANDVFLPGSGDCVVAVTSLNTEGVEGTFDCGGMKSVAQTGAVVSATGTFSASVSEAV
jgi:hypothetical protein